MTLGKTQEEDRKHALDLATRRLAMRDYSTHELRSYLENHGVSPESAQVAIDTLVSRGALDNQRYISTLVQNAARSCKGPAYIQSRLEQKGLKADSEIVRALYQEASGGSELESARALIEKKYPRAKDDERELKRAFAALIRRGFSDDVVRKALGGRNEWPED